MSPQGVVAGLFAISFAVWGGLADSFAIIIIGIAWAAIFTYHALTDGR